MKVTVEVEVDLVYGPRHRKTEVAAEIARRIVAALDHWTGGEPVEVIVGEARDWSTYRLGDVKAATPESH